MSNTDQQMSFRKRWSSRTRSRMASGSWSRCQRHSSRWAVSPSPGEAAARRGPDRVGGSAKLVCRHVRDGRGLGGRVGGMPRRPCEIPGRGVGMAGRRASLGHRDLALHPGACLRDRMARAQVLGPCRLKDLEDVLRTGGRPQREEPVIPIAEGSAAADGDETRVALFRQDHTRVRSLSCGSTPRHSPWKSTGRTFRVVEDSPIDAASAPGGLAQLEASTRKNRPTARMCREAAP